MGETNGRGTPLRPIVLCDLDHACNDLGALIGSAYRWLPEEEWDSLADELRPHVRAAAELIRQSIAKYRQVIDQQHDGADHMLGEFVYTNLAALREELKGRRVGIRGYCEVPVPLDVDDVCNRPL